LAAEKKIQRSEPFPDFAGLIFYEHFGEGGGAGIGSFGWVGAICSWGGRQLPTIGNCHWAVASVDKGWPEDTSAE